MKEDGQGQPSQARTARGGIIQAVRADAGADLDHAFGRDYGEASLGERSVRLRQRPQPGQRVGE